MIPFVKSIVAVSLIASLAQEGGAPRELTSDPEHWINSTQALKLSDLQGKVVWLEFGTLK